MEGRHSNNSIDTPLRKGSLASVLRTYQHATCRIHPLTHYLAASSNGSTYYYDLAAPAGCQCIAMGVGLLRPDFLRTSGIFVGENTVDGIPCYTWKAGDAIPPATGPFMTYNARKTEPQQPVSWTFYSGARFDVMSWTVPGAPTPSAYVSLPSACLNAKCQPPPQETMTERFPREPPRPQGNISN